MKKLFTLFIISIASCTLIMAEVPVASTIHYENYVPTQYQGPIQDAKDYMLNNINDNVNHIKHWVWFLGGVTIFSLLVVMANAS